MRIYNQNGIALVTALMFTLLSLGIAMLLLYMLTSHTQLSGAQKRYKTAVEASYGTADLLAKDIIPQMFQAQYSTASKLPNLAAKFSAIDMNLFSSDCMNDKRSKKTSEWSKCSSNSTTDNAALSPDLSFKLPTLTGKKDFIIYTKIIDTRCGGSSVLGQPCSSSVNTPFEDLELGQGVPQYSVATGMHLPAYYRIEVQGERVSNAKERAKLSVLYAY